MKRRVVLVGISIMLIIVLYVSKNFLVDKIYNDIILQKEIHYLEFIENVREETIEVVNDEDSTVYVTMYGKKYHCEYCGYLRHTKDEMELEKAIKAGYEPCAVCKP